MPHTDQQLAGNDDDRFIVAQARFQAGQLGLPVRMGTGGAGNLAGIGTRSDDEDLAEAMTVYFGIVIAAHSECTTATIGWNVNFPTAIASHKEKFMRPEAKLLYIVMILIMCLATSCINGGEPVSVIPSAPPHTPIPTRELVAVIHGGPTNTPIPTVVEPGLAYGVPCKPPCWRGVVPGQSTRQETAQAIEQLHADGWADHIIGDNSVEWRYEIYPSPFTSKGRVDIYLDGNGVKKIYGTVLFYYSVGTLIEQFGPPEGIHSNEGVCSSCEEWEPPESLYAPVNGLWVDLLYPTQGLWFWLEIPGDGIGCICPEMKMVYFCYYAPVSMQEAMKDNYLANLCAPSLIDVAEEDLVEWHGFGGGY